MKTLDLKRGLRGEYLGSVALIDEIVNFDDLAPSLHLDLEKVGQLAYIEDADGPEYQRAFELLGASNTRVSRATNIEWDFSNGGVVGALTEQGANSVRWNPVAGLINEAASTNEIRNPRGEGFTSGALGSGGAVPTNWTTDAQGATITVDALSGYANGSPRTRIRFSGTPTGDPIIWFEAADQITAATAENWSASIGAAIAAGDLTNVTGVALRIQENTAAGAEVTTEDLTFDLLDAEHRRFFLARTLAGGGTVARLRFGIVVDWDGSGAVDLTLDFFAPQLEQASAPTSPIFPVIGTPAARTRAADSYTSLVTSTRASRGSNAGAWDFTNGGAVRAYRDFPANVPRITARGLLVEEGSTNQIRNPRAEGAAAGTPGTAPTNYQVFANGATLSIVGSGYENGWPYFECRLNGTPTQDPYVDFEASSTVSANNAEDWTTSVGVKLTAGDLTNISGMQLSLRQGGASDAFLSLLAGPDVTPTSEHKRFFYSSTTNNASIQFIRNRLTINWDGSGAIDITLRIYAPQLEQKAFPTSPILPPAGTLEARTRVADDVEVANGAWSNDNGAGTLYVNATLNAPYVSGNLGWLGAGYGADNSNSIRARAASSFSVVAVDGGATQASLAGPTITGAGQNIKSAFAWDTNDFASSFNGVAQATDSSGTVGFGAAKLLFGIAGGSGQYPSQYVKDVRYWPRRLTNAELEALVGNP